MSGSKLANDSSQNAAVDPHAGDHALGLTVHSMPSPDQTLAGADRRTFSGRVKMLIVLLVCAAPVIASYFMYYVVRPEGRRNFGELIDPQRSLPNVMAQSLTGDAVNLKALKGQWLLVSVSSGACNADCVGHLYLQRQMRESLGKDKDRVDWVWLVDDDLAVDDKLRAPLQGATVLRVAQPQLATWLQPAPGQQLADHIYLVDPMGNWMMRFPAQLDLAGAAKAKRDLERLLRASASWDNAGR
jgi:hypothetical protein